jgi:hypothetical protein
MLADDKPSVRLNYDAFQTEPLTRTEAKATRRKNDFRHAARLRIGLSIGARIRRQLHRVFTNSPWDKFRVFARTMFRFRTGGRLERSDCRGGRRRMIAELFGYPSFKSQAKLLDLGNGAGSVVLPAQTKDAVGYDPAGFGLRGVRFPSPG